MTNDEGLYISARHQSGCAQYPLSMATKVACTHHTGLRCRRSHSDCRCNRLAWSCHSCTGARMARSYLPMNQDVLGVLARLVPIMTSFNGFFPPPPVTLPCSYTTTASDVASLALLQLLPLLPTGIRTSYPTINGFRHGAAVLAEYPRTVIRPAADPRLHLSCLMLRRDMHGSQVFLSSQHTSPIDSVRCICPSRIKKEVRPKSCEDR